MEWSSGGTPSVSTASLEQPQRPPLVPTSGGLPHASAIARASTSPATFAGTGGVARRRLPITASTSPPASANRLARRYSVPSDTPTAARPPADPTPDLGLVQLQQDHGPGDHPYRMCPPWPAELLNQELSHLGVEERVSRAVGTTRPADESRSYVCKPEPMDREGSPRARVFGERAHAARSIEEARKSPNNVRVGVVIARDDTVLARGFKGEVKGLHAEEVALQKARDAGIDVTGAELFTTLEPCANSRTRRVPCAERIAAAGIAVVHIGEYDPNPQVNRLGWKYLRDQGVRLRDFPADLRTEAHRASENYTRLFTMGTGMSAGAKFDFTTNGGRFTIRVDDDPTAASWETRWNNCGASAIYMDGGRPGVVALARYANEFDEIDDPDALDYGHHSPKVDVGSIGVMRNEHGHVLCKVTAIEPTADYGGDGQVSVTIKWQIRLAKGNTTA